METCPYCMIDVSRMVGQLVQTRQENSFKERFSFFAKRSVYRAQRRAEDFSESMSSIGQVIQQMKEVD